jgi:hypothetical protein
MDGTFKDGMYSHPNLGLIKIFSKDGNWVYQCYTSNGQKPLSSPKPLDQWTWVMSEER